MSEEEKKAIEIVEEILNCRGSIREDIDGHLEDISSLRTLLDIIDKQQKEIKKEKEKNKKLEEEQEKIFKIRTLVKENNRILIELRKYLKNPNMFNSGEDYKNYTEAYLKLSKGTIDFIK